MSDIQRLDKEMSGSTKTKGGGLVCHIDNNMAVYTSLKSRHIFVNTDIESECWSNIRVLKLSGCKNEII